MAELHEWFLIDSYACMADDTTQNVVSNDMGRKMNGMRCFYGFSPHGTT